MSTLIDRIKSDTKEAMKARDSEKLGVLRMLSSAIKYAAIDNGGADKDPSDGEVITVVRREVKKRQDSLESYTKAGREDLAKVEEAEITVLEAYLPAQLDEAAVKKIVADAIKVVEASSIKDMGKVMKVAQEAAAGAVDNKTLSGMVKEALS